MVIIRSMPALAEWVSAPVIALLNVALPGSVRADDNLCHPFGLINNSRIALAQVFERLSQYSANFNFGLDGKVTVRQSFRARIRY